jgi:hypothetical protein
MSDFERARRWTRVKWTSPSQLAPLFDAHFVPEAARNVDIRQFFQDLSIRKPADAARLIAQCLPRHEAVRWAADCVARTGIPTGPARIAARKAVSRWIGDPSDQQRRLAMEAGQEAGFECADGLACLAVFLSGGSLAPASVEGVVHAQQGGFGRAVSGCAIVAALQGPAPGFDQRMRAMLLVADLIAAGEPVRP